MIEAVIIPNMGYVELSDPLEEMNDQFKMLRAIQVPKRPSESHVYSQGKWILPEKTENLG